MEQEGIIRLSIFFGLFFVFTVIEYMFPRRKVVKSKTRRWVTNWSVSMFNVLTLRLFSFALPLLAIGAAFDAQNLGIGLFNQLGFSFWVEFILVILILDFFIWLQHLLTHKIEFLWRIHRVHHSEWGTNSVETGLNNIKCSRGALAKGKMNKPAVITDGLSNTIMFGEAGGPAIGTGMATPPGGNGAWKQDNDADMCGVWIGSADGAGTSDECARYVHRYSGLNSGKTGTFGSDHAGIVGFVMADGATTFLSETINSNANDASLGSFSTQSQNAQRTADAIAAAADPARGVLQKLANRADGNPASIPE